MIITKLLPDLQNGRCVSAPQHDLSDNPPYKRRKVEESDMSIDDIAMLTFEGLYNQVRALADPNQNCIINFVTLKIVIQEVEKVESRALNYISWEVLNSRKDLSQVVGTEPLFTTCRRGCDGH